MRVVRRVVTPSVMKNFTEYNDTFHVSSTLRHALDTGCYRRVPDTTNDLPENWKERIYRDGRPLGMRKAKVRR